MIPELGHFALIIGLCFAFILAIFPMIGATTGNVRWMNLAKPVAYGQLLFVGFSYVLLTWAFISHDFSVAYVVNNSNTTLPLLYLVSGVWGAHEGSLLLWALILTVWTAAVAISSDHIPKAMLARVLSILGFISIGFLLFIILTSNPFDRIFPMPFEGRDLNPLLQDPGLAIHPPMLYLGYVGFSVAFAFAIAALISGHIDTAWARWCRPWTNAAWMFLTLGIALGSWWAYYELGWGGWWFWDPVENASFMPWLLGTALIHSLAITEKRGTFKAWSALLAIFVFSLSLLGMFLVRSGVLTSVHAFASDPERGIFILMFLGVVVGASLLLYAWRAPLLKSASSTELFSRDMLLLLNNVFLTVVTIAILLGTLYPILVDAGGSKISVGPPYFNFVFILLMAPIGMLLGVGMFLRWKKDTWKRMSSKLLKPAILAAVIAIIAISLIPQWMWQAVMGLVMAAWVFSAIVFMLYERVKGKPSIMKTLRGTPAGFYGMLMAHLGVAVFIVGVTLTSLYTLEKDLRMEPGDIYSIAGYDFVFEGVKEVPGPNYMSSTGRFNVTAENFSVIMHPEKRIYARQDMPMTEAAIDDGLFRDLFVALGEPIGNEGAWAVRIYYKPFIRWIWLGSIFMALGGFIALFDRRYTLMRKQGKKLAIEHGSAT